MLLFAKEHPEKKFLVTKLGSSLAGYTVGEIKGLFEKLKSPIPDNVVLPKEYEVRRDKPTVYQEPSNIVKDFAGKEYTQAEWDKLQSDTRKNFDENGIYKEPQQMSKREKLPEPSTLKEQNKKEEWQPVDCKGKK